MTRPNIVRADTIDLQDQDNPSAADHQKPQIHGGLAPHQRAEVHHVLEERSSEEHALADAWNISGGSIVEEPDLIEHAQEQHASEQDQATHGMEQENGENGEGEDDDMMDRISSSPSIDDGGYLPRQQHIPHRQHLVVERVKWPPRTSSLSPSPRNTPTPTRETFNQSSASSTSTLDSSPFLQTPQHLPLHVRRTGRAASPLAYPSDMHEGSPLADRQQRKDYRGVSSSKRHHSLGRYRDSLETINPLASNRTSKPSGDHSQSRKYTPDELSSEANIVLRDDQAGAKSVIIHDVSRMLKPIESPFRVHPFQRTLANIIDQELEHSPSLTSIASIDLQDVLLPVDDPLLDTPPSPTDSTNS